MTFEVRFHHLKRHFAQEVLRIVWSNVEKGFERAEEMLVEFIALKWRFFHMQPTSEQIEQFKQDVLGWIDDEIWAQYPIEDGEVRAEKYDGDGHLQFLRTMREEKIYEIWAKNSDFNMVNPQIKNDLLWKV